MMMTFQEEFGTLPMTLLRTYRKVRVTPYEHDAILRGHGHVWSDDIPTETWATIVQFVNDRIHDGRLYLPRYM